MLRSSAASVAACMMGAIWSMVTSLRVSWLWPTSAMRLPLRSRILIVPVACPMALMLGRVTAAYATTAARIRMPATKNASTPSRMRRVRRDMPKRRSGLFGVPSRFSPARRRGRPLRSTGTRGPWSLLGAAHLPLQHLPRQHRAARGARRADAAQQCLLHERARLAVLLLLQRLADLMQLGGEILERGGRRCRMGATAREPAPQNEDAAGDDDHDDAGGRQPRPLTAQARPPVELRTDASLEPVEIELEGVLGQLSLPLRLVNSLTHSASSLNALNVCLPSLTARLRIRFPTKRSEE